MPNRPTRRAAIIAALAQSDRPLWCVEIGLMLGLDWDTCVTNLSRLLKQMAAEGTLYTAKMALKGRPRAYYALGSIDLETVITWPSPYPANAPKSDGWWLRPASFDDLEVLLSHIAWGEEP